MKPKTTAATALDADGSADRVARLDWKSTIADLDGHGDAVVGPLISPEQCAELAACYDTPGIFRSHVVMGRHGFGRGEYRYFSYPLPPVISGLRNAVARPGVDFTGGEFVLTEQRPRMQSRVEVVSLDQGKGVIFPVHHRPVKGTRGTYRVNMRHGVSRLRSGRRHTLGIIFHDAI